MNPMFPLLAICIGVWYLVKQTSIAFQSPRVWDCAELAAALVGVVGYAYIYWPVAQLSIDPIGILVYRTLVFGTGVLLAAVTWGVLLEEKGMLRTPDGLAPPKARLFEKVSSVDELDDETLAKYTEETVEW